MTTLAVSDAIMNNYVLSITTRDGGDTTDMLSELTYRTIKAWLWIVSKLEQGETMLPLTEQGDMRGSVEDGLHSEFIDHDGFMFPPLPSGDARVTVWDTFKSQSRIGFHLNSDDIPQIAVNTWLANHKAIERILSEQPQKVVNTVKDAPNSSATPADKPAQPKHAPQAPVAPPQAVEGAIVATRAPSKARQYADGQVLIFNINKIVKGTNKGSVTYNCWGDLGKNYALKTIYMTKSGSDEKSSDYIATKGVLEGLNLSVDAGKIEAHGNWQLVTKVAHGKNGKGEETEFFNALSLTAI